MSKLSQFFEEAYNRGYEALAPILSKKILDDQRGVVDNIISVIIVVVVLMLSVLIVAPLQEQAQSQVDALNNTEATATFADVTEATWGAISTFSIVPYVVVFIVIIGLIMGLATPGRR